MSTVIEIETAFRKLPPQEQDALIGRLEEICENHLELSDEYQAKLKRAEQQLAEGLGRIRQPQG
jgi:ABC-type Zn uptake system ZnuABC Zn-binding protein ZnuA